MDRSPLDPHTLSPAAQKALGPGPGRMMAARGLVPLPPGEHVAVLYQLSLDVEFGSAASPPVAMQRAAQSTSARIRSTNASTMPA